MLVTNGRLTIEGIPKDLEPPFLLLSNHVSNQDMFCLQAAFNAPLTFVGSTDLFCHGFGSKVVEKLFRPISIFKGSIGVRTAKEMIHALRRGEAVAMFPEGRHSPDGRTGEIRDSVASLAKVAKCPLVTVSLHGYFRKPRWAEYGRIGPMHLRLEHIYSVDELKEMDNEELYQKVLQDLSVNAYQEQEANPIVYRGKRKAVGVGSCYYYCPCCEAYGTITGEGNTIRCTACGAHSELDDYGYLSGDFPVREMDEWWDLQTKAFRKTWEQADEAQELLRVEGAELSELDAEHHAIVPLEKGTFRVDKTALYFNERCYPWNEIPPVSMRAGPRILLDDHGHLYEFDLKGHDGERVVLLSKWAREKRNE